MPFRKVAPNKNVSPSGRVFTDKQVALYYATDGFTEKPKPKARPKPKGGKRK